jgi:hypothetical protein
VNEALQTNTESGESLSYTGTSASSPSNSEEAEMNAKTEKPSMPYADIIVQAIFSTPENQIQLKDIYKYMIDK